jgi:hypothetical protein
MNNAVASSGVEAGFTSGKKAADVEKSLLQRVDKLLLTYEKAKKLGRLDDFIKKISQGDGCLTARMGRIEEFQAELLGFGINDSSSKTEINLMPIQAISNFFQSKLDASQESVTGFSVRSFDDEEEKANLDESFKMFERSSLAKHFIDYLEEEKLIQDKNQINWNEVVPKLLNKPDFMLWLEMGKKDALDFI